MNPDTQNTWMEAELGPLRVGPPLEKPPGSVKPSSVASTEDIVLFFTRVIFGLLFSCHGAQKLFGLFGAGPMYHDPWMMAAGIIELGGGVAIALGIFTRPLALLMCGEMAVAYFKVHFPQAFWPIENHGEPAVLYCFFYLYLAIRGAGAYSVDGLRQKA